MWLGRCPALIHCRPCSPTRATWAGREGQRWGHRAWGPRCPSTVPDPWAAGCTPADSAPEGLPPWQCTQWVAQTWEHRNPPCHHRATTVSSYTVGTKPAWGGQRAPVLQCLCSAEGRSHSCRQVVTFWGLQACGTPSVPPGHIAALPARLLRRGVRRPCLHTGHTLCVCVCVQIWGGPEAARAHTAWGCAACLQAPCATLGLCKLCG